ncbi:hypothetical protein VP01_756g4 [Puccinia sorghi]|uniref:Uncharacterized protein n=1 Tax=Puccinia sorghi TaxID=27349 RepID=A0A0L6UCW4_9BASI|nr:hypothetical protein VP01_756g4 [Puccinia sorghi]
MSKKWEKYFIPQCEYEQLHTCYLEHSARSLPRHRKCPKPLLVHIPCSQGLPSSSHHLKQAVANFRCLIFCWVCLDQLMLQPICHTNSTCLHIDCTSKLGLITLGKRLEFLRLSACQLQAFEQVFLKFLKTHKPPPPKCWRMDKKGRINGVLGCGSKKFKFFTIILLFFSYNFLKKGGRNIFQGFGDVEKFVECGIKILKSELKTGIIWSFIFYSRNGCYGVILSCVECKLFLLKHSYVRGCFSWISVFMGKDTDDKLEKKIPENTATSFKLCLNPQWITYRFRLFERYIFSNFKNEKSIPMILYSHGFCYAIVYYIINQLIKFIYIKSAQYIW